MASPSTELVQEIVRRNDKGDISKLRLTYRDVSARVEDVVIESSALQETAQRGIVSQSRSLAH